MFRKPSLCLLCQQNYRRPLYLQPQAKPWIFARYLTQIQRRRKPARMALSSKVAQLIPRDSRTSKPPKANQNSPFGGMNQRNAKISSIPRQQSRAQALRSTRGRSFGSGEDKAERGNDKTFHALKMQRALATVSYASRTRIKSSISEIESFRDFPLLPVLQDSIPKQALIGSEDPVPSPIQRLSIPGILGGLGKKGMLRHPDAGTSQFLIAAETGSGKTLAYVLPVIDAIKRAETIEKEEAARKSSIENGRRRSSPYYIEPPTLNNANAPHSTTGRPRAIILVPTAELVDQVNRLLKSFSHVVKFRAAAISASYTPQVIRNRLFSPRGIDILVATPHLLSSILTSDPNVLSHVTHLVVDEADSLMDRSFAPITSTIIDKAASSLKQLILCSATIPRSLDSFLRSRFPDMRRFVTPNLHAIPRRIQLGVVDVIKDPYRGNKDLACADTIYTIGKSGVTDHQADSFPVKYILVFVNEREKTEELSQYLRSKGIDARALHRDITDQRRAEILEQFTTQPLRVADESNGISIRSPSSFGPGVKRPLLDTKVLVTTDLGSRGIDTLAVRHVILYDVPHSSIDFIHRLGRTGRMGRRGRGIVLVGKGDRRDVVREVREGMFRGQALI